MRTLENRIARLETLRAGAAEDFIVVHLRNFCSDEVPSARFGGYPGTTIKQVANEPFETFQARAIVAARAAGDHWGVAITVPESSAYYCPHA